MILPFKSGKEVEWIELTVLCTGQPLSKATIMTASEQDEEEVDNWLADLEMRIQWMGPSAPYSVNNGRVTRTKHWNEVPEYLLCAHYSYHGVKDRSNGPKLFERISGLALEKFVSGKHIALGFPSSTGFNDQLTAIATSCYEVRQKDADGKYKDDRVDVVAFKLFEDKRPSNLYVLMQCAAGAHWRQKKEINMGRWTNYLEWYSKNIVVSFSTTDVIDRDEWQHQTSEYGILLDRLRIYRCLYATGQVDDQLRADVLKWCKRHTLAQA